VNITKTEDYPVSAILCYRLLSILYNVTKGMEGRRKGRAGWDGGKEGE
jgi:hypothetical protein